MDSRSSRSSFRFTQATRVALVSAIFLCIHWQHDRFLRRQVQVANWSDVLPVIREILPEAESVDEANSTALATVLDADHNKLGSVVRTASMANHILGFSGPTDVLLVFDQPGILIATRVISSRDTRDHVQQMVQDPAVARKSPRESLKFPHPPRLEDVKLLYPDAARVKQSAARSLQMTAQAYVNERQPAATFLSQPAGPVVPGPTLGRAKVVFTLVMELSRFCFRQDSNNDPTGRKDRVVLAPFQATP